MRVKSDVDYVLDSMCDIQDTLRPEPLQQNLDDFELPVI